VRAIPKRSTHQPLAALIPTHRSKDRATKKDSLLETMDDSNVDYIVIHACVQPQPKKHDYLNLTAEIESFDNASCGCRVREKQQQQQQHVQQQVS
jgi:hypothetical protein